MEIEAAPNKTKAPTRNARGHMQEEVFQHLRRGLIVGVFLPGETMSLRKLAALFGTSSMPVREALARLVMTNALEEAHNGSVQVPRLTLARLTEIFAVRSMLEGMAAEMACKNSTAKLIRTLTVLNEELLQAIEQHDRITCLSANQRFHFTLYEAAGSAVLMPLIESLWLQFGPTMYLSLDSPVHPWDASAHLDVLEGLRLKKPELARSGILKDIDRTGHSLETALKDTDVLSILSNAGEDLYFGKQA